MKIQDPKLQALVDAVKEWYDHTSGHDVGPLLNKVANAYVRLKAGTGQPTDRTELPPIVPGMLSGGIAQADAQELDQESLDAFERAGREKLILETAEAWKARAPVEETKEIHTSGWVQTVKTITKELLDESGAAFNNYFHKIAAGCSRAAWDKAYCQLAQTRASCSAKEIFELARLFEAEDPALASSYDARHWAADTRPLDQVGGA